MNFGVETTTIKSELKSIKGGPSPFKKYLPFAIIFSLSSLAIYIYFVFNTAYCLSRYTPTDLVQRSTTLTVNQAINIDVGELVQAFEARNEALIALRTEIADMVVAEENIVNNFHRNLYRPHVFATLLHGTRDFTDMLIGRESVIVEEQENLRYVLQTQHNISISV